MPHQGVPVRRRLAFARYVSHRRISALLGRGVCQVSRQGTHVDFLVVDRVTHRPVLGVETDGYAYHKEGTDQHARDAKKNSIFEKYGLPLIRLSTRGSDEEKKIRNALNKVTIF